ncbi:topoisomerase IV [Alteromonas sp. S015]|uniref:topoisomerase IV n=1 Tax=Alteromonas sp. S015 TaxID=3117401 RepID=UPI002FE25BF1
MKTKLIMLSLAGLFASPTFADIQINGFANLIGGITLDDDEAVYGYDSDFSFDPASVFGLQVRGEVSDKLSATAQIVGRGSDDYDASFEWAYMTYALSSNSSISAGRIRLPLFKYSASLDVGYSYHWLTPPDSVYGVLINNMDGVRYDYSNYHGDWEYGVQVFGGHSQSDTLEADKLVGVSFEAARDWFSVRSIYARTKFTSENESLATLTDAISNFAGVVPSVNTLSNSFLLNEDSTGFFELALAVDKYDWFIGAEYTHIDIDDSPFAGDDAWYVTAGMRFGKFTPHITYEHKESDANDVLDHLNGIPTSISTGDAATDATWATLYQTFVGIAASQEEDRSAVTAGLRYDVEPGFAVKSEVTWYTDEVNDSNDATLLRVGVNYTF